MQRQPKSSQAQTDQCRLFILRVWQDKQDGLQRYMLKAADDDHRHLFKDVRALANFLEQSHPDTVEK